MKLRKKNISETNGTYKQQVIINKHKLKDPHTSQSRVADMSIQGVNVMNAFLQDYCQSHRYV